TTVAGNGFATFGGDGGAATSAGIFATSVAVDQLGNLYIADQGHQRIRKVGPDGVITTVAGNGDRGFSGDGGLATAAALNNPIDVAVDRMGRLYIGDTDLPRIRVVDQDGIIHTLAGNGSNGHGGDSGPAAAAGFLLIRGLAVDTTGAVFLVDHVN